MLEVLGVQRGETVVLGVKIKVEGDITVLMALQMAGAPTPEGERLQAEIKGMTE